MGGRREVAEIRLGFEGLFRDRPLTGDHGHLES